MQSLRYQSAPRHVELLVARPVLRDRRVVGHGRPLFVGGDFRLLDVCRSGSVRVSAEAGCDGLGFDCSMDQFHHSRCVVLGRLRVAASAWCMLNVSRAAQVAERVEEDWCRRGNRPRLPNGKLGVSRCQPQRTSVEVDLGHGVALHCFFHVAQPPIIAASRPLKGEISATGTDCMSEQ